MMADEVKEGEMYRLKENVGKHRKGTKKNEDGERVPDWVLPGELVEAGKDLPIKVIDTFDDKFEKVEVIRQNGEEQVVTEESSTGPEYTENELESFTVPVLKHIFNRELDGNPDDVGTEHSESDKPVKRDWIDAILRRM